MNSDSNKIISFLNKHSIKSLQFNTILKNVYEDVVEHYKTIKNNYNIVESVLT